MLGEITWGAEGMYALCQWQSFVAKAKETLRVARVLAAIFVKCSWRTRSTCNDMLKEFTELHLLGVPIIAARIWDVIYYPSMCGGKRCVAAYR